MSIYDDPEKVSEVKKKDGYSYATSMPAYQDNKQTKEFQRQIILNAIQQGYTTLLQIAEKLKLPQSTVSGRVNDLIEEKKVQYEGLVIYKHRKRKQIVLRNERQ